MGSVRRILVLVAAVVVTAALLPGAPAAAADATVTTVGLRFVPSTVVMPAGGSFTHTNVDTFPHGVVSDDRGPDGKPLFSGATIQPGESADVAGVAALAPGSYDFICRVHPLQMRGTLRVTATPAPAAVVPTGGAVATPTSITVRDGALYAASLALGTVTEFPILPAGLLGPGTEYASGFSSPLGVVFGPDGTLFVADSHPSTREGRTTAGRVWAIPPGGGAAADVGEIVLDELPNGRHNTNGMAVHDGRLYVANGNSTDDGVSGGAPELPLSGTLLSVRLDQRNLTPADLQPEPEPDEPTPPGLLLEASGMRNLYDVAFRPGTDEAWIPTNGPDQLDPYGVDLLHRADVFVPPVDDMAVPPPDFGFPACVYNMAGDVKQNPAVADTQPCGDHTPPEVPLGLHVSANGLAFGPEGGFWDGDLFIAYFGNFFGDEVVGHEVVRVPIDAAGNAGAPVDLVPGGAPLDVTFGDAGLYVADFGTGQISLVPTPPA